MTEQALYTVAIATEKKPFERNDIHTWVIEINDKYGSPVEGARIAVGDGIPHRGHDLTPQPEMTAALGQDKGRIDGVRFHVFGWWEFSFDIDVPPDKDHIAFNLNL